MNATLFSAGRLRRGLAITVVKTGYADMRQNLTGHHRIETIGLLKSLGIPTLELTVPMEKLDDLVANHLEKRLLNPTRLGELLSTVLDRRQERSERIQVHIAELNKRATETDLRLKRLYDAIESGVADRVTASLDNNGRKSITPQMLSKSADTARKRMRLEDGGHRRDYFRALAQRVEVDTGKVRIIGSKSNLLQTLTAAAGTGTKPGAVPSFVPKWCTRRDSNPWPPD